MSSLLPDEYMTGHGSLDDLAFKQVPEIGYDDCHPYNPFFDGDLSQGLAAWHQDTHTLAPPQTSFASEDLGPVAGLAHSVPVYYHHNHNGVIQQQQFNPIPSSVYVAHQPAPHYLNQQHALSQAFQVPHRQPTADGYDSYSECGSEVSSSYGSYSSVGAPISTERVLVDNNGFRVRVRNTSAPPTPLLPQRYPQNAHFAQSQTPIRPTWGHGHYTLSASYGDQPGALSSYQEPPTMGFSEEHSGTYRRQPVSSPRQNARRRPSGVPALAFGTLSLNHSQGLAPYSPASLPPMSPHSPQSQASMSDPDSPGSNPSTPRSSTSTPRSTTSTPRSMGNEKKRSRSGAPHPLERERRVRPKVVAEKGALQCKGVNRKKNARCRNAALMEYIGPRPLYCAEHITLDPESFYSKCASSYHKVMGDGKGCREVVLKELEFCHKHYSQAVDVLLTGAQDGYHKARTQFDRISFLLAQLETEATAAKRTDPDLFQRKHKLIPKFMEMKKLLHKRLVDYEPSIKLDEVDTSVNMMSTNTNSMSYMLPKVEESAETPKDVSSSTTTSPSETSEDACTYDEPSVMMQVEQRHYPVY